MTAVEISGDWADVRDPELVARLNHGNASLWLTCFGTAIGANALFHRDRSRARVAMAAEHNFC